MKVKERLFLFCFGGFLYYTIETIWKGSSHWSMFLVGGFCFRLIGHIRTAQHKMSILTQCVLCSFAITAVEFVSGCIVNRIFNFQVWDYSTLPFNVLGQICLPFTVLWCLLSYPALYTDQFLCQSILETD